MSANDARSSAGLFAEDEPGRRGEILDAAAFVFAERGYDSGSMRDIATRVGVTEPALYRHFPGKHALFLAMMRLSAGRARGEALALIDALEPASLHPQLLAAFADRRQALAAYAPILRTVLTVSSHDPEVLDEFRRLIVIPARERLSTKAAELDAAFCVPDADRTRDARVRALLALLVGYFVSSYFIGDEPDDTIADAAVRLMGWERSGPGSAD